MPLKHPRRNKVKLAVRRKTATERQTLRNGRTPQQQLEALDKRLGKGKGAKRERARLEKLIAEPKVEKTEKKAPAAKKPAAKKAAPAKKAPAAKKAAPAKKAPAAKKPAAKKAAAKK